MKILSILLRLVAIGAAAYAWYTWDDTKGKTSESMEHMKEVQGDTLQLRTQQVPSILAEKRKTEAELKVTKNTLEKTEGERDDTQKRLEGAMGNINELNSDLTEKRSEISSLKAEVADLKTSVAEGESEVERLESEIVKIKAETEPLIADLQSQIVNLEDSLSSKETEIAEAVAAAEAVLIEQLEAQKAAAPATIVTVDPTTGRKVEVVAGEEYIPEGEIVKVLKINDGNTLFVIDRIPAEVTAVPTSEEVAATEGEEASPVVEAVEYKVGDKIQFKKSGKFIGEFSVLVIDNNLMACGVLNKDLGIPEVILVGDSYELIIAPEVVEVEEEIAPAPVAAPVVEDSFEYSNDDFSTDGDFDDADFSSDDMDFSSSDNADFGDTDFGDTDFSSDDTDFGDTDFSSDDTDFGDTDFGDTDFGDSDDIEF